MEINNRANALLFSCSSEYALYPANQEITTPFVKIIANASSQAKTEYKNNNRNIKIKLLSNDMVSLCYNLNKGASLFRKNKPLNNIIY